MFPFNLFLIFLFRYSQMFPKQQRYENQSTFLLIAFNDEARAHGMIFGVDYTGM